jgi:hypothetical protein
MADVCDDDGVSGENLVEEGDRKIPFPFLYQKQTQLKSFADFLISCPQTTKSLVYSFHFIM